MYIYVRVYLFILKSVVTEFAFNFHHIAFVCDFLSSILSYLLFLLTYIKVEYSWHTFWRPHLTLLQLNWNHQKSYSDSIGEVSVAMYLYVYIYVHSLRIFADLVIWTDFTYTLTHKLQFEAIHFFFGIMPISKLIS